MKSTKLTFNLLRKIESEGLRAPRLTQLASFLNDNYGEFVTASVKKSWSNTDRKYRGSRLRCPGKGRDGNELTVKAAKELSIQGFSFSPDRRDTFLAGAAIFSHDSSETYRYNGEAVRKVVQLVGQLRKAS